MSSDKVFADGFIAKRHDNAPDFVITGLSVKVSEAKAFLDQHANKDWVNLQVKRAKSGKLYVELDTWEPNRKDVHDAGIADARKAAEPAPAGGFEDTDIPF
jgi:hypothetical protein